MTKRKRIWFWHVVAAVVLAVFGRYAHQLWGWGAGYGFLVSAVIIYVCGCYRSRPPLPLTEVQQRMAEDMVAMLLESYPGAEIRWEQSEKNHILVYVKHPTRSTEPIDVYLSPNC